MQALAVLGVLREGDVWFLAGRQHNTKTITLQVTGPQPLLRNPHTLIGQANTEGRQHGDVPTCEEEGQVGKTADPDLAPQCNIPPGPHLLHTLVCSTGLYWILLE